MKELDYYSLTPGPTRYDLKTKLGIGIKFPKSQRPRQGSMDIPGPGEYFTERTPTFPKLLDSSRP